VRSRQALVVETSKDGITVLTSDGQFRLVPIKNSVYMVGEQITLPDLTGISTTSKCTGRHTFVHFLRRRLLPIAAVASFILCASFFGYTKYLEARPVLAWVTIDLVDSPGSMELEVNDKGLIKSVTYFDEETERLASSLNLYMKPVDCAVEALLKNKQQHNQPEVVIGIIPVEEDAAVDRLEEKILKDARKAAEKAAKQTAKAAEKAVKQAARGGKPAEKAPKETEHPKDANPKGAETKKWFTPAAINHIRLDKKTREVAKELKISAARAAIWALFDELHIGQAQDEIQLPEALAQPAGQSADDGMDPETATGPNNKFHTPGKPADGHKGARPEKEQLGQSKDEDRKPKAPPGQAKKQADFRFSIPKPGIEKIKGQSQEIDKSYLSEIAREWAEKVKQAQASKAANKQGGSQADGQQKGKPSNNNSGNAKGNNKQTDKPGNAKGNKQATDRSSNNKASNNKPDSNKPGNNKPSKTEYNRSTRKPNTGTRGKTTPWGK
jgi:hypothetical protein